MGRTVKRCFSPGEVLNRYGTQLFGIVGAEPPIVLDYVNETNGSFLAAVAGGSERDWWDDAIRADYIDILVKRHPKLKRAQLEADGRIKDRLRWPDILTYDGVSSYQVFSGLLAPIAQYGRHEFYEIKP